jgi:hypothetical protein
MLGVLLPHADDATLDRLLADEAFAFERQTPVPSKMVVVKEPLELRAAADGTRLIARRPTSEALIDLVLRAAGPAITELEILDDVMAAWSESAWTRLDRPALRTAKLQGENSAAVSSLLSGATGLSTLRVDHAVLNADEIPSALCRLELEGGGAVRARLLQALARCPALSYIDIASPVDADGMAALATVPALTELFAWGSGCGDSGAKAIAAAPAIAELTLTSADIGDDGAEALAAMSSVWRLWLSRNRIGARGASAIARMSGLDDLSLDSNSLDDDGVRALSPLRGLSRLTVKHNPFSDPEAVLAALRHIAERVEVEDDPYDFGGVL